MHGSRYVFGQGAVRSTEKAIRSGGFTRGLLWEEAEHAAKFKELLGEVVNDCTKRI